jgi:hypothetical protein
MGIGDQLLNTDNKDLVVQDCCDMIDAQLASKSGLSGMALKTAFAALKGIKPNYIRDVVELLLPSCFVAIDPLWQQGTEEGDPVGYLTANSAQTADVLLSVTDEKVKNIQRQIVKGIYQKFRNSASKHVEEAVPDFAQIIGKYLILS